MPPLCSVNILFELCPLVCHEYLIVVQHLSLSKDTGFPVYSGQPMAEYGKTESGFF